MPAVTASLAYLDARFGVSHDAWTVSHMIAVQRMAARLEAQDRINSFYVFEQHATDAKSANRLFLIIPTDPDHPNRQTEWTYAEAYETVLKYARWLKEVHGVQKEEIVGMDITNKPLFIWLWFALWSLGAKPAFINTNLRSNAFVHCVRVSTARLLLVDPQIEDVLNDETKMELSADGRGRAVDTLIVSEDVEQSILAGSPYRAPDEARSGEKARSTSMLIYTVSMATISR